MKFYYNHDDERLEITARKVDVNIWFEDGEAISVTLNDEPEFETTDDILYGIFVNISDNLLKPQIISLNDILVEAIRQYDGIAEETLEEIACKQAMAYELSSPSLKHLRHTCVIDMERAGSTPNQISSVTGHKRKTVSDMIDNNYGLDRDEVVANLTIANLAEYRKRGAT